MIRLRGRISWLFLVRHFAAGQYPYEHRGCRSSTKEVRSTGIGMGAQATTVGPARQGIDRDLGMIG